MARGPLCELCRAYRPGSRRRCVTCFKMVGPGCDPERCLSRQINLTWGICKECHRNGRIKLLTKTTPMFLSILLEAGF